MLPLARERASARSPPPPRLPSAISPFIFDVAASRAAPKGGSRITENIFAICTLRQSAREGGGGGGGGGRKRVSPSVCLCLPRSLSHLYTHTQSLSLSLSHAVRPRPKTNVRVDRTTLLLFSRFYRRDRIYMTRHYGLFVTRDDVSCNAQNGVI